MQELREMAAELARWPDRPELGPEYIDLKC